MRVRLFRLEDLISLADSNMVFMTVSQERVTVAHKVYKIILTATRENRVLEYIEVFGPVYDLENETKKLKEKVERRKREIEEKLQKVGLKVVPGMVVL